MKKILKNISLGALLAAVSIGADMLPAASAADTAAATPSAHAIYVDGERMNGAAYVINGNNYFKLRDIAAMVNGSARQFEVVWNQSLQSIDLFSNSAYTAVGGELASVGAGSKTATPSAAAVFKDSSRVSYIGYNIENNNYYKLRDLCRDMNIGVAWDAANSRVDIITTEDYEEADSASGTNVLSSIPAYSGSPYAVINNNVPSFEDDDFTSNSSETYSELDSLGRCGAAYANIGQDLMPTEERGSIGQVKPSGWHTVKYDNVDGKYLYNRCHLIGYQLTAENANEKNLITGTRYLNIEGMLPFENMTADYIEETGNHVLYRVTPVFEGNNLVADGVLMEAESVEDRGEGILFCVYCYNVQPGITIDYATGDSAFSGSTDAAGSQPAASDISSEGTYILNTSSKKFHLPDCSSAKSMSESNKQQYTGNRADLIEQGYAPCRQCNP